MTSVVSICNLALARIRALPIVNNLGEDTNSARLCSTFYEPNRDATLEAHPWNFAIKRVALALDAIAPTFEYGARFALPADFLRIVRTDSEAQGWADDYRIENGFLLCFDTTKSIEYIYKNTDPNAYSATFVDMLAERLAADLSVPLMDNANAAAQHWNIYASKLAEARNADAQQGKPRAAQVDTWLNARL